MQVNMRESSLGKIKPKKCKRECHNILVSVQQQDLISGLCLTNISNFSIMSPQENEAQTPEQLIFRFLFHFFFLFPFISSIHVNSTIQIKHMQDGLPYRPHFQVHYMLLGPVQGLHYLLLQKVTHKLGCTLLHPNVDQVDQCQSSC